MHLLIIPIWSQFLLVKRIRKSLKYVNRFIRGLELVSQDFGRQNDFQS